MILKLYVVCLRTGGADGVSFRQEFPCTGQIDRKISFAVSDTDGNTAVTCVAFVPDSPTPIPPPHSADQTSDSTTSGGPHHDQQGSGPAPGSGQDHDGNDDRTGARADGSLADQLQQRVQRRSQPRPPPASSARSGRLWCGTTTGIVGIFNVHAHARLQDLEDSVDQPRVRLRVHTEAVTALLAYGGHVWAGSADGIVFVLRAETASVVATLRTMCGAVTRLCPCAIAGLPPSVWVATAKGYLMQYDATALTMLQQLPLRAPTGSFYAPAPGMTPAITGLYEPAKEPCIMDVLNGRHVATHEKRFVPAALLVVGSRLWIGTGRHIIVLRLVPTGTETAPPTAMDGTATDGHDIVAKPASSLSQLLVEAVRSVGRAASGRSGDRVSPHASSTITTVNEDSKFVLHQGRMSEQAEDRV